MKKFLIGLFLSNLAFIAASQELRVYFKEECPVTEYKPPRPPQESAAVAALGVSIGEKILTGIISNGVEAVIKAIKPEDKPLSYQSNRNGFFREGEVVSSLNCLVVVVGKFSESQGVAYPFKAPNSPAGTVERLAANIALNEEPGFYLEASLSISPDRTAFTWEPRFVYFGSFLSSKWLAGNSRDIVLTLQLVAPVAGNKIGEVTFLFPSVEKNTEREYKSLGQAISAWSPLPAEPTNSNKRVGKTAIEYMPFTLKANYVEKAKPGEFATVIFSTLESEKENIKNTLAQEIVPSKKAEKEQADSASSRKIILDYAKLRTDYEKDCAKPLQDSLLVDCQFKYLDLREAYGAALKEKNKFYSVEITVPPLSSPPTSSTS